MTDLTAFMNAKPRLYTHDQLKTKTPIMPPVFQQKPKTSDDMKTSYLSMLYNLGESPL